MNRRRIFALLLTAGLLAGCTLGPSQRPFVATSGAVASSSTPVTSSSVMPTGPGGPGREADPIEWQACPSDIPQTDPAAGRTFVLDCAEVRVPRSYQTQTAARYSIEVTRVRAAGTPITAPLLVTVLGSPGANGTEQAAAVAGSLPAEITAHFAILVLDLRGTGRSSPIDCVSAPTARDLLALGPDPTSTTAGSLIAQLTRTLTFDCGDEAGTRLSSFATIPATDDLDTVRAAVGVSTWSFLGRGFGATLGAVYADRYPGRVATMVLDGPADPLLNAEKQADTTAAAAEAALDSLAAACPTFTGGCPLGDDPRATVAAAVTHLGDIGVNDSDGDPVTGGSALLALMLLLGTPARWPDLAAAIADAGRDNTDALAALLLTAVGDNDTEGRLAGAILYECNDAGQRLTGTSLTQAVATAKATAPLFGPFAISLVGLCGSWPVPDTPLGGLSARGAPPLLVLGAADDPLAPYSGVTSLSGQLASATLLTWQSGTHGSYPASACITTAVDAYLLKGTVPQTGTLCPP